MVYHLAPSLVQLRAEANAVWPGRSKVSDGWIGDTAHGARTSDHNPDYRAGGVVRAIDLTNAGLDPDRLVAAACADIRTAYVISRGLIYVRDRGFRAERYTGANGHHHHVHISIRHGAAYEQSTAPWGLAARPAANTGGGASITPTTSEEDDMYWLRVNNGQGRGDVYEVTAFTVDKITLQQFEDIKGVIVPRMTDATEAAVTRLAARKAALRRHIWGPDKGGK